MAPPAFSRYLLKAVLHLMNWNASKHTGLQTCQTPDNISNCLYETYSSPSCMMQVDTILPIVHISHSLTLCTRITWSGKPTNRDDLNISCQQMK